MTHLASGANTVKDEQGEGVSPQARSFAFDYIVEEAQEVARKIEKGTGLIPAQQLWQTTIQSLTAVYPDAINAAEESAVHEAAECIKQLFDAQAEGRENSAQVYSGFVDQLLEEQGDSFRPAYRLLAMVRRLHRLATSREGSDVDFHGEEKTDIETVMQLLIRSCEEIREDQLEHTQTFNELRAPYRIENTLDGYDFPSEEDR